MQQNQKTISIMKTEFAGTDAQKGKKEIKKDVSQRKGAMTSRKAGSMQD
jgi:hypothetical protein